MLFAAQITTVSAQSTTKMKVYKTDGNVVEYSTSEVDSVTFSAQEDSQGYKTINGHRFIDLALPSGLLWAETNIGAETAADDGCYFAWGETDKTTKPSYKWDSYKHGATSSSITKYNKTDGKTTLDNEDDAAYVNWGDPCRMPTKMEFVELNDDENCIWSWTTQTTSSGTEVKGYKVTSVRNGNSIFLPASGQYKQDGIILHGSHGRYWSSSLDSTSYKSTDAYYFIFDDDSHWSSGVVDRYAGNVVRPVAEP